MSCKQTLWVGALAILGMCATARSAVYRVDAASNATSPDGSNWNGSTSGKCFKYLSEAIAAATSANDQIWIAQGTYRPDEDSANPTGTGIQSVPFVLNAQRIMLGGFKGVVGYPSTADDRDPSVYVTILSGDLDQDDDPGEGLDHVNRAENSHTVVLIKTGADPDFTRLDGVTIRDGNGGSQQSGFSEVGGAGIFVEYQADPTIQNCVLTRNGVGTNRGGAILLLGGTPLVATVMDNIWVEDNEAGTGGGLDVATGNHGVNDPGLVRVSGSTFLNNRALNIGGGAIMISLVSEIDVVNSRIAENSCSTGVSGGGGGIYAWKGGKATFRGCSFVENVVDQPVKGGGAVLSDSFSTVIAVDCLFEKNRHDDTINSTFNGGGAVHIEPFASDPDRLINCLFAGNEANFASGGAVLIPASGPVEITNCVMTGNSAEWGGAILARGKPTITNCTITQNQADRTGGCMFFAADQGTVLTNSIVWNNDDTDSGTNTEAEQLCVDPGSGSCNPSPTPSDVSITYSDIDDGTPGGTIPFHVTNIDANPVFADPDGLDNTVGTVDDNFALLVSSPCIDTGSKPAVPADAGDVDDDTNTMEQTPLDRASNDRFVFSGNTGLNLSDCVVDMGAFEFEESFICDLDVFGDMNDDTNRDGLDIQGFVDCILTTPTEDQECICARGDFRDLDGVTIGDIPPFVACILSGGTDCDAQYCPAEGGGARSDPPDCNDNSVPDDVDILTGTSEDCNGNGIPDECDVDVSDPDGNSLVSDDDNSNGTPDECEDCNENGVPDDLDISGQTSQDCNSNQIPDECEPDCDGDGTPNDCETFSDCDDNGILDDCDPDCDNDGVPDACELSGNDCNGNNFPDDCEIDFPPPWNLTDCNNDNVPDVCQISGHDCNENGILDECDIANSVSDDENENGIPDECETESLIGGGSYSSSSSSEFDEAAAWASYFDWCAATDFSSMNNAQLFSAQLAKRIELGLPAGQSLPD